MYTTKIGHAHLKVRDLDRAVAFYERFLKLHVTERVGDHYVFMTGGAFHHEIALQRVAADAPAPEPHGVGLYHVAFEVPGKREFAEAFQALREAGVSVGAVDHFISWAMYFDDPDSNGLEIYWDTRGEPGGKPLWRGENVDLTPEEVLAALAE
ncbi:MAG TPA: VOC family protein [Ktedonobacterales bacterium]